LQIAPLRRRYAAERRLAGELFQFMNGMSKLRSAGAEASAFASWARGYREQHVAGMQIARLNEHLVAFSAAVPALVGAALFGVAVWQGSGQTAVGDFLVVYSVSMTFYTAIAALGRSLEAIATVVPGYEQVKPIFDAVPDGRVRGTTPAELSGDILFDHLSFRYTDDSPLILDDVSIHARPGEFVAIVGESGAGKSTLLRLALGLEEQSGGGIYYDGHDLVHLDRHSVRRQIGVVMQDGNLHPGNLLDNIIGVGDDLTIDDAWRAARLADVDKDIAAMPMEMFTIVGDSSSTFSGGQIQRIRIAAALVRDPRIVFLDEATSWLDAKSQAQVMQSIESVSATRIVIAHRLSTIRKAERIYVLQAGRVVQEGSFDELFQSEGPFRDLVQRQMI
jgi:ATP-binding cassette subfamily C protein